MTSLRALLVRGDNFIAERLTTTLIFAFLVGFLCPGLEKIPKESVPVSLGLLVFLSCFKVEIKELRYVPFGRATLFVVFRFILFPVLVYFLCAPLPPVFRTGVLLLSLMPAGVGSAPVTVLCGGNFLLSLILLGFSSGITIAYAPLVFPMLIGSLFTINQWDMFKMISLIVALPIIIYALMIPPFPKLREIGRVHTRGISVLLLGVMVTVVTAKSKVEIVRDTLFLAEVLSILLPLYCMYYLMGWYFPLARSREERISYALSSGLNNNGLGIGLALMYFPPKLALFMVLTEIPWVLGMGVFKRWISNRV